MRRKSSGTSISSDADGASCAFDISGCHARGVQSTMRQEVYPNTSKTYAIEWRGIEIVRDLRARVPGVRNHAGASARGSIRGRIQCQGGPLPPTRHTEQVRGCQIYRFRRSDIALPSHRYTLKRELGSGEDRGDCTGLIEHPS